MHSDPHTSNPTLHTAVKDAYLITNTNEFFLQSMLLGIQDIIASRVADSSKTDIYTVTT
jgi:hypothetical protein